MKKWKVQLFKNGIEQYPSTDLCVYLSSMYRPWVDFVNMFTCGNDRWTAIFTRVNE